MLKNKNVIENFFKKSLKELEENIENIYNKVEEKGGK